MGTDDWPDWLPVDWTVNIRKIDGKTVKCFVDPEGHTCYSKPEVFGYLKKTNKSTTNEKAENEDDSPIDIDLSVDPNARPTKLTPRTSRRKSNSRDLSEDVLAGDGSSLSSEKENKDSWLPEGWTVEVKIRKGGSSSGMRYKCYTDPISGQKFFSKPQVLNYLAKSNRSAGESKETFTEPISATPISATPISAWQEKSTTDNPQTYEATEVKKKTSTGKKTESTKLSRNYDVVSRTPVEGLPAGWIKEVRVRKHGSTNKKDPYYVDPLSEYVFLSKKDALRYLESGDVRKCVMKPLKRDLNDDDTLNVNVTPNREELTSPGPSEVTETPKEVPNGIAEEPKTNESDIPSPKPTRSISGGVFNSGNEGKSGWLPDGWVVEVHYKNSGQKFKVFKEVSTGKKLYSKPQVLNYIGGGSSSNSTKRKEGNSSAAPDSSSNPTRADVARPKRAKKKNDNSQNSDFQEIITTSPADGLPPGWIKEVRTKIWATHKRSDPFYTDPVSGYIFRSKMDAMRYLETGDVNLCAIRPKVKDKDGNEVFVYTNDAQKPGKSATAKGLFEDKEDDVSTENHEENQTTDPKTADNTKRKTPVKNKKQGEPSAGTPARSSKRQRGMDPGTGATNAGATEGNGPNQVKQAPWVNLEKQPADVDGNLAYDIPEDDSWTDQCIDFAVKTLANEILFNGQPLSGQPMSGENDQTPTKVN